MENHVTPLRTYLQVFLALMGLTALTTWVAFVDLGAFNDVVAMGIACTKALLVVLIFMHLKHSNRLIWLFAAGSVLWLLLLFGLTMADFDTRIPVQGWAE